MPPLASDAVLSSPARVRCFYDLDTGVTLDRVRSGQPVDYIPEGGLGDFDLVLSYTGGLALAELKTCLGARHVAPLYGSVDPEVHHPAPPEERFRADLSYLGTYAADRQRALEDLFIEPARRRPDLRFVLGGPQYPGEFPWTPNLFFIPHVPPERAPGVLLLVAPEPQRDARSHGGDGLLPFRPSLRSRRLRRADRQRRVGRPRLFLRARARNHRRAHHRPRDGRARDVR